MKKPNRKCVICGNEYYYCNHGCADSLNKPAWMATFCCENCKKVYDTTAKYNMGKMASIEARVILDGCDLSAKKSFASLVQKLIDEIYELTKIEDIVTEEANVDESENVAVEAVDKVPNVEVMPVVVEPIVISDMTNIIATTPDSNEIAVAVTPVVTQPTTYKKKKKKKKND